MEARRESNWLSFLLCIVLLAAAAWMTTGCGAKPAEDPSPAVSEAVAQDGDVLGEGETECPLTIADKDGNEIALTIRTDKTVVGEALQELGLLEGEEGPYGLYVKTVDGITLDYETHGMYWAFYVNGEYGMSGCELTDIVDGTEYAFKAEK